MNTFITRIVLREHNNEYSMIVYCLETDTIIDYDDHVIKCTFENESSTKDMSIYHVKKISDRLYDVGFLVYRTINNYLPGGERIIQPLLNKMDNIIIDINNIYFFIRKKDTPYLSAKPELYIDRILF